MDTLKSLPTAELAQVIDLYPWFNAARVEMCKRKVRTGEAGYAEAALYIGSRKLLYDLARDKNRKDCTDKTVEHFISEAPKRKVHVVGGDFFSQDQYDDVRKDSDKIFSGIAANAVSSKSEGDNSEAFLDFCTETLAQIYADQGYYEQAKHIYSKLILRYPEKNAYFAALIEKLEELKRN